MQFLLLLLFVACGYQPGAESTALCGSDAPIVDTAPPAQCLAIIGTGQSNQRGDGRTVDLTGPDVVFASPYAPVDEVVRLANGTANPPAWTEFALSPTQPRAWAGIDRFGVELTMVRDLVASRSGVRWIVIKAAIGGTTLNDQWKPSLPAPNIFGNVHDWIDAQLAATGCTPAAYVWIQGESDAMQVSRASAYGSNLVAFVNAVRVRYPGIPFIYGRLNVNTAATYTAQVRTGQQALSLPDVHMIDQDTAALRTDGLHFTTAGVLSLGHVYASAVLAAVP